MNTVWCSELQDSPVRCSVAPAPFLPAHPCIRTQAYPDLTQTSTPQPPTGRCRTHFCPVRTPRNASNIQHMHSNTVITHMLYSYIPPSTCPANNRFSPYVSPHPYIPQIYSTPQHLIFPHLCLHCHRWMTLCTHRPMDATPHPSSCSLLIVIPSHYRPPPFLPRPSIRMK